MSVSIDFEPGFQSVVVIVALFLVAIVAIGAVLRFIPQWITRGALCILLFFGLYVWALDEMTELGDLATTTTEADLASIGHIVLILILIAGAFGTGRERQAKKKSD